jgi:hypothetical protein
MIDALPGWNLRASPMLHLRRFEYIALTIPQSLLLRADEVIQ